MREVVAGERLLEGVLALDWLLLEVRRWKTFLKRDDIGESREGGGEERARGGRVEKKEGG